MSYLLYIKAILVLSKKLPCVAGVDPVFRVFLFQTKHIEKIKLKGHP